MMHFFDHKNFVVHSFKNAINEFSGGLPHLSDTNKMFTTMRPRKVVDKSHKISSNWQEESVLLGG